MNRIEFARVTTRITPVLALALLAGGCAAMGPAAPPFDRGRIPLQVHFNSSGCPTRVTQTSESCAGVVQPEDDLVCRHQGQKISWITVKDDPPPYLPDEVPEFAIEFKLKAGQVVPVVDSGSTGDKCKTSRDGALDCKVRGNAKKGEYYEYVVHAVAATGPCVLDPRVYVH